MKLYKMSAKQLKKKCQDYIKNNPAPTPRHFRASYLKVSRNDLKYLKEHKPILYKAIDDTQDYILSLVEKRMLEGVELKQNPTAYIFILRSYDPEQYAPDIKKYEDLLTKTPYNLVFQNKSNNKLIVPVRKINSKETKHD